MTRAEALARLAEITDGIDRDELDRPPGWWETSTGAEAGAEVLADLVALVTDLTEA